MKASYLNWLLSLILLLIGVLALVLVYQNVYKPMAEENDKLRGDIQILELSVATQQGYKKDEAANISRTEELNAQADAVLSHFPVDLWEEDHIAYVDYLLKETGMNVTSLNWGQTVPVANLSNGMVLNSETITINYVRSYASMKDLIDFIVNDEKNQTSLTTLSISYNAQQDVMSGVLYLQRYYLSNQGKEHEPAKPEGDIEPGQDNILD